MDVRTAFIADTKATILVQPAQGAFDHPAEHAQATAVLGIPPRQNRLDAALAEVLPMGLRIVGSVTLHAIGTATRPTGFAGHSRNGVDEGKQLGHIVAIGCREPRCQRDAVGIGEHVMLRALFPTIRGIGPGVRPPKTARTEAESTIARDQSILSALRSWFNKSRWSSSQTPARCQSRSRRQHVIPLPQPISCGRYSHGMPVMRTNRIPVRASRLPTGFRPGYRRLRGLGLGKIGSIRAHRASSKTCFAMCVPPCTAMAFIGHPSSFC
jgi:hypothetical protein